MTRFSFTFPSVYQAIVDMKDDLFIIRLNVQTTAFYDDAFMYMYIIFPNLGS